MKTIMKSLGALFILGGIVAVLFLAPEIFVWAGTTVALQAAVDHFDDPNAVVAAIIVFVLFFALGKWTLKIPLWIIRHL